MTFSHTPHSQTQSSLIQKIKDLVLRSAEPNVRVSSKDYYKFQLLTYLLMTLIPLGGIAFGLTLLDQLQNNNPDSKILLYLVLVAVLFLSLAYIISRTKYYHLTSSVVVGVIVGAVLATSWIQGSTTDLQYLAVGILVSSLFQSTGGTLSWLGVIMAGTFLLSFSIPNLSSYVLLENVFFTLTIGAIAVVYTSIQRRYLNLIEERSNVLAASEQALRETRDHLEMRVAERTIELEEVNSKLQTSVGTLEKQNLQKGLLAELGELLQACKNTGEANKAIEQMIPQLFQNISGVLLLLNSSRDNMESIISWGNLDIELNQLKFDPEQCWALRRGRPHRTEGLCTGTLCKILPKSHGFICVPLVAHGEMMGVLHLRTEVAEDNSPEYEILNEPLAITTAENISLALANLKLSETLRHQSIRDPLTDLYNRRFMEETLSREIQRAARSKMPLGVIMLDIDHFKNFNDMFGHDAGDAVLRELGVFLKSHTRGSDIACRYGGEEFILILPETQLEVVHERAETIRSQVKNISIHHRGQSLKSISLSLGVGVFPEHETNTDSLIRCVDQALYQAKKTGRDKVVVAKCV
ncbi:MAG: diguanylate cyclase [Chloroflexi bacterium]|nr:diguanylate cyclase [Chloroflexota bacterium]MBT5337193.1 diguanylate cyclase [Chloroflexota bacterium]MBT6988914.1 diguanylate cyclase [Chloroflexota bacterium]